MNGERSTKLQLVQSFRGIAAIAVVLFHVATIMLARSGYMYANGVFLAGWSGVDFFFLLSGFIIFYVHHKDIGNKNKLKNFVYKRLTRIYPVYLIISILLIPIYVIIPSWGEPYVRSLPYIIKSLILFPQSHSPLLAVGWSLVYEMFFYIIFGLVIWLKRKISIPIIGIWVVITLLNFIGVLDFSKSLYLNFIFNPFNVEFLLGCVVAYLVTNFKISKQSIYTVLGIIFFIISCVGAIKFGYQKGEKISIILFGLSGFVLLLGSASIDKYYPRKIPKFFVFLGDASYSIYLVHYIAILFLQKIFSKFIHHSPVTNFIITTAIVVISILLCIGYHVIIEKPIMKFFKRMGKQQNKVDLQRAI